MQVGKQYAAAKSLRDFAPHIYALGARAFHNLQHQQGNQCLLVSGESGAGNKIKCEPAHEIFVLNCIQGDKKYFNSAKTSDLQFSLILQTHVLVL